MGGAAQVKLSLDTDDNDPFLHFSMCVCSRKRESLPGRSEMQNTQSVPPHVGYVERKGESSHASKDVLIYNGRSLAFGVRLSFILMEGEEVQGRNL